MRTRNLRQHRKKWMSFTRGGRSSKRSSRRGRPRALRLRPGKTEGDDCISATARGFFKFFEQTAFQVIGVGLHFAGCDLLRRCALIAEFANTESIFGTNGWTEDAAGHGTRFIKLTESGFRV